MNERNTKLTTQTTPHGSNPLNDVTLTSTEALALLLRCGWDRHQDGEYGNAKGRTLDEVGKMLGVTRERVRQYNHRTLEKLLANLAYARKSGRVAGDHQLPVEVDED